MSSQKATLKRFLSVPRLSLANLPTPIEECGRIRKILGLAPRLFIKRDDDLGFLAGGNKLRKLEYALGEARRRKADAVITVGSVQSNHARITAMVARRLGMPCILVLNGEAPLPRRGNFLVAERMGAEIHLVGSREERAVRMEEIAAGIEARGGRVYRIPLGASNAIGALGFVTAFLELLGQTKKTGIRLSAVFISSSSGGTQAGLEAGRRLFGRSPLRIIGVSPDDPIEAVRANILSALRPLLVRLGSKIPVGDEEIEVEDRFRGPGYGVSTPESEEAARLFARLEGILLDPVYTSKGAAAFLDYARRGVFGRGQSILFWHTGGLLGLF